MTKEMGILLEGGAMRSIFSAGVLDFMLEKGIEIPNVLAVSAGAYAGMNYVSGQKGRILRTNVEPLRNGKYMGFGTFLKKGSFFDMDLMFDEMPKRKEPFDFEAFFRSDKRFITSTVDCITGESVFWEDFSDRDPDRLLQVCRAANSMPLIAPVVELDGRPMLDGGAGDALPIGKVLEEGWKKIVVVFTRDAAYRKKPSSALYRRAIKRVYGKYPRLMERIDARAGLYNASIDRIAQLEREGRAFVLRPTRLTVQNKESDPKKLLAYYRHGYETAEQCLEALSAFLEY